MHCLPRLPGPEWYAVLGVAALALLQGPRLRFLVAACAAFAWTAHAAGERLADRLPQELLGQDFAVSGWIDAFPVAAVGQTAFSFAVTAAEDPRVPRRLRLTWYEPPETLAAGMPLELVVRLRPPRGLRNPGGFDYERWLLAEGYGATGYVRSGRVLDSRTDAGSWPRQWAAFRARLAERIAAEAPSADAAALVTALAIGERFRFTEEHWAAFRRTGTSHLVAVSGLHVALFGLAAFWLVRRGCLRLPAAIAARDLECAALAAAVATAFYAALSGFAIPAQRSLLMIVIGLGVVVSRRAVRGWHALAAALTVVLIYDPFAPLAASFWLSFGAVALLFALAGPRDVGRAPRPRVLALARLVGAATALQWSIGLALVPLAAALFAEVSLVGPVVNLLAIPWFNLVLVPAALGATASLAVEPLGAAAVAAAGHLAAATVAVLRAVAALDHAAVGLPHASAVAVAIAAVGAVVALPSNPLPGRRLGWLAFAPLVLPRAPELPHGAAEVTVLDVGHGLAVIVATRTHRLLYDAGPRYPSGFDVGRDIVVPLVGGGAFDKIVASHADNDHAGGLPAVLAAAPRADLLRGPDLDIGRGQRCRAGQRWIWDGVEFSILHPPERWARLGNDGSCVLKVAAAGGTVLITGDVEAAAELRLAADPRVRSDAVVVPHHGSATSSTPSFVAATRPSLALVSAGYANRWGFPRPDVRARWEEAGARVWVTGDVGAITLALTPGGAAVRAERLERRRYWHAP